MNYSNSNKKVKTAESAMMEKAPPNFDSAVEKKLLKQYAGEPEKAYATMWSIHNKKNESTTGIRVAKEGIEECWDDMGGQGMMNQGNGEQMSVTISMPGKNISVTTDSADEIGNILRLAGINVGGSAPEQQPEMGGYGGPVASSEPEEIVYVGTGAEGAPSVPEQPVEEPEVEEGNEFSGALAKAKEEHKDNFEVGGKEYDVEEAVGDKSYTAKGGTVTQTATGLKHQAGSGTYGGTETDSEEDARKKADDVAAKKELGEANTEEENDDEDGRHDLPMPNGEYDDKVDEAIRILQLAGITNEAQSAAQKAAFAKMIAKKNGDKPDEETEEKEVDESARIIELAGVNEWANSPDTANTEKDTYYNKLPSREGTGAGNKDFGANRANGQGENPMGIHATDVEEAFANAMGEYRKFVAENIAGKK